jgi:hypothetical protein
MVLAHWNSSSHVDMYHHWYTLTCFWARQWICSFSLKLYAQRKSSKYQFYSSWFNSYMAQTRKSTALTANTLTLTLLIRAITTTRSNHFALQSYNFRVSVFRISNRPIRKYFIFDAVFLYTFFEYKYEGYIGLWYLTPLTIILQLYHGGQFYNY